jgi:farnesyl-diphosphate farnesyltransferase
VAGRRRSECERSAVDEFLSKHLLGVSRTYALVVPMLPRDLREPVGLAYLLMRIVDTIEDDPALGDVERLRRFAELEAVLADDGRTAEPLTRDPIGETPAERELMAVADEVIARLRSLPAAQRDTVYHCAREMMRGVRLFMQRAAERAREYPAVETADEMREYCYFVAGVVGIMLNELMADHLRMKQLTGLRELAVELGIGLQLVNVLKDALKDSTNGRRYLPSTRPNGPTHADVYRLALAEARKSLGRGVDFVLALPAHARELRHFCGLPLAWGAMTLSRAEDDASRAKISREAIIQSIERFTQISGDDTALRRWLRGMLNAPASSTTSA